VLSAPYELQKHSEQSGDETENENVPTHSYVGEKMAWWQVGNCEKNKTTTQLQRLRRRKAALPTSNINTNNDSTTDDDGVIWYHMSSIGSDNTNNNNEVSLPYIDEENENIMQRLYGRLTGW
jgi:hypothetical protein